MKMRSHSRSATLMSWVEKTTVVAAALQVEHGVLEHLGVDRVEARERLVEDHQLGLASTAAMNWTFCAMPFERASTFLSIQAEQPQPLEPVGRSTGRARAGVAPLSAP